MDSNNVSTTASAATTRRSSGGDEQPTTARGVKRKPPKAAERPPKSLRRGVATPRSGSRPGSYTPRWNEEKDDDLRRLVTENVDINIQGGVDWDKVVSSGFPDMSVKGVKAHYTVLINKKQAMTIDDLKKSHASRILQNISKEDQAILDGIDKLQSYDQIAKALGKERSDIKQRYYELRALQTYDPKKKYHVPWTEKEYEILLRRWCTGLSDREVAEYLPGRHPHAVEEHRIWLINKRNDYYRQILEEHNRRILEAKAKPRGEEEASQARLALTGATRPTVLPSSPYRPNDAVGVVEDRPSEADTTEVD
jgi:hypothetical protein